MTFLLFLNLFIFKFYFIRNKNQKLYLIMPLIIMVGGPCSGKTTAANKLKEFIETEKHKKCYIVNEEAFQIVKTEAYKDSASEKINRAKLKSETEKLLDDNNVVIIDSLNYIKGYRYELYCLVRNFKTRHCIVYCKSEKEICQKLNEMNSEYPMDLLNDLYSRMEEPNPSNRWDNPLHMVYFEENPDYDGIYNCLFEGKRPRDPVSAKPEIQYDSSFLHELDSICQEIINEILAQQLGNANIVESIKIKNNDEENFIYLKKIFSAIELKKLKAEYIKICKIHPPKNKQGMIKNFIEYINTVQDRY